MGDQQRVRQAGAIVFRSAAGGAEILLVRAKRDDAWIFPKGHLEAGESVGEAALRETSEESGVSGALVALLEPPLEFRSNDEDVSVRYGLVRCLEIGTSDEPERATQWLPIPHAIAALTHPEARRLLVSAVPLIESAAPDDAAFREWLLVEFQTSSEALLRNEEDGERRVNAFVAVVTAAGAVLAFIYKDGSYRTGDLELPLAGTLLVLALFGYLAILRVVNRNRSTDQYKEILGRLRRYVVSSPDDVRRRAFPFDPFKPAKRPGGSSFGKGGWLETVVLIESIALGGIVAALVPSPTWKLEAVVASAASVASWFVLMRVARYKRAKWDRDA